MASIEEKQIAKEILINLINSKKVLPYAATDDDSSNHHVEKVNSYFSKILEEVSK